MLVVALAAALHVSIYQFNLGPVKFELGTDRKWELSVKHEKVLIDLDRLKIRAVRHNGTWSTAVLPFRDQGILSPEKESKKIKLLNWPPEWLGAKSLRVEYEARYPDYLWHERFDIWKIETPLSEGNFKIEPGQRYIVIPDDSASPKFKTLAGERINANDLAFKTLKLLSSDADSHKFMVEATRQEIVLDLSALPITHLWLDGITAQIKSLREDTWLPFSGLSFMDGSSTSALKGQPITLVGIYSLAKPRQAWSSEWEFISDRQRPSLEPGLAVFSEGKEKLARLKGMLMPTVFHFQSRLQYRSPEADFQSLKGWDVLLEKQALTVQPGMTQMQVLWIMGWPLDQTLENGPDSTWNYRSVPHYNVIFKDSKVVKVDVGRLP